MWPGDSFSHLSSLVAGLELSWKDCQVENRDGALKGNRNISKVCHVLNNGYGGLWVREESASLLAGEEHDSPGAQVMPPGVGQPYHPAVVAWSRTENGYVTMVCLKLVLMQVGGL